MDRQTDRPIDGWTDGQTCTDRQMDGWIDRRWKDRYRQSLIRSLLLRMFVMLVWFPWSSSDDSGQWIPCAGVRGQSQFRCCSVLSTPAGGHKHLCVTICVVVLACWLIQRFLTLHQAAAGDYRGRNSSLIETTSPRSQRVLQGCDTHYQSHVDGTSCLEDKPVNTESKK